jgi:hypothetical protein
MATEDDEEAQAKAWETLYGKLRRLLNRYGTEDIDRSADFWIDDDNMGVSQHAIYVRNLRLLDPAIIANLQRLLAEFPGWDIVVIVSVPEKDDVWPDMGLTVRAHEIIDGLQRHYFPEPYRNFSYAGSRPGTERD